MAAPRRSRSLLAAEFSQMAEPDQFSALLIPKTKGERLQTAQQRDWLDALKQWIGPVAPLQVIVRNSCAQVMNVVKADVA